MLSWSYRNYTRSGATLQDMQRDPKSLIEESKSHSEQTQIDESSIFQTWFDSIENPFSKVEK